jgi:hypothetical protein
MARTARLGSIRHAPAMIGGPMELWGNATIVHYEERNAAD